jgi:hypothetical protein
VHSTPHVELDADKTNGEVLVLSGSARAVLTFHMKDTLMSPYIFYFLKLSFIFVIYSVEITYGINSIISKLMTFVENAETGQFLFLVILILSYFTCS